MAELAYAHALGACSRKGLRVQISPSAPDLLSFYFKRVHYHLHFIQIRNHYYNLQNVFYYLSKYGYGFIFLGTIFEGELVLLTAGFLAFLGVFNLWLVIIVAFFGASVGDNFWYHVGHIGGIPFLQSYGKYIFLN